MVLADADADTGLLESRRPRRSSGESRPATTWRWPLRRRSRWGRA